MNSATDSSNQFVDDLVSRLLEDDDTDPFAKGLSSLFKQTLAPSGDEPEREKDSRTSYFDNKYINGKVSPTNSTSWPNKELSNIQPSEKNLNLLNSISNNNNNNNVKKNDNKKSSSSEPLKIFTSELSIHTKDVDSGYLSPNNTNGFHVPGKPELRSSPFPQDVSKFPLALDEEIFGPALPGQTMAQIISPSKDPNLSDTNLSSSPEFRPGYLGFSSPSTCSSRPSSQDLDGLFTPVKSGLSGSYQTLGVHDSISCSLSASPVPIDPLVLQSISPHVDQARPSWCNITVPSQGMDQAFQMFGGFALRDTSNVDQDPLSTKPVPAPSPSPSFSINTKVPPPNLATNVPPPDFLRSVPPPTIGSVNVPLTSVPPPQAQTTPGVRPPTDLDITVQRDFISRPPPPIFASPPPAWMSVPPPVLSGALAANGFDLKRHKFNNFNPPRHLNAKLDQCYEGLRQFETERKKIEAELSKHYPGKNVTSTNNTPIPRLPPNPSRVDRLILDHLREHARVATLCSNMERLRGGKPMHRKVQQGLKNWMDAIKKVQLKRREEIVNPGDRSVSSTITNPKFLTNNGVYIPYMPNKAAEEKAQYGLANTIYELNKVSRTMRTTLWAAFQSTVLSNHDSELESGDMITDDISLRVEKLDMSGSEDNSDKKSETASE